MPLSELNYHGDFDSRGMMEAYACHPWKRLADRSMNITDMPTLDAQDALMAKKDELVAVE